jgi:hypothetical protein
VAISQWIFTCAALGLVTACKWGQIFKDSSVRSELKTTATQIPVRGPYLNSELWLGSDEFWLVQGYTVASALACGAGKVGQFLGIPLAEAAFSPSVLANVSQFYLVSRGRIIGSISENLWNLKRILTELGENTLRKNKSDSYAKGNFTIHRQNGFFGRKICVAKVKEDLLSGTVLANLKQQFRILSCEGSTIHTAREATITNYVRGLLNPPAPDHSRWLGVWYLLDNNKQDKGPQDNDQRLANIVKVETDDYIKFYVMATDSHDKIPLATIKQGDIQTILASLPDALLNLPGRLEAWRIRKRPGLAIHPLFFAALASLKSDTKQEELRKADRLIKESADGRRSCIR